MDKASEQIARLPGSVDQDIRSKIIGLIREDNSISTNGIIAGFDGSHPKHVILNHLHELFVTDKASRRANGQWRLDK